MAIERAPACCACPWHSSPPRRIGACDGDEPGLAIPAVPADWVELHGAGDLWLSMPPLLVPFERSGAVFANQVVPAGDQGLKLLAEGPRTATPQPEREGAQRWLEERITAPDAGPAIVRDGFLPAGSAIRIERVDRVGTSTAWRLVAYAISTPHGTAYLLIDCPPEAWTGRDADLALIAQLVRTGPGTRAVAAPAEP